MIITESLINLLEEIKSIVTKPRFEQLTPNRGSNNSTKMSDQSFFLTNNRDKLIVKCSVSTKTAQNANTNYDLSLNVESHPSLFNLLNSKPDLTDINFNDLRSPIFFDRKVITSAMGKRCVATCNSSKNPSTGEFNRIYISIVAIEALPANDNIYYEKVFEF